LNATLSGLQTAILVNINLGAAETQRIDIAMKIGSSGTTVSVAQDQSNNLSQSSISQVLSEQKVRELPLVSNDVLSLLGTMQGVDNQSFSGLSASQVNTVRDGISVSPAQGQQGQQGQGGAGGGRGGGGGTGRASATTPPPPQAAPPPPPPGGPPAATYSGRIIPDNPTVVGFYDNIGRANTASYAPIIDNPFLRASQEELSTFSSDVDTASYANLRRFINQNQLPPAAAVRIEEMINYFPYDYAQPTGKDPIGASMEIASAPWSPTHRLVRIGIKARDIDVRRRPSSNLVFLIDVSGSMQPQERLPLIKNGLKMLVGSLTENDHVSLVVYASASGVVLPWTSGNRKDLINAAIDRLEAGGSTNGGAGIQQAYQIATANFIPGGVNRVILATDGDFNVGVTNQNELTRLIQERAKSGVFLSVLGVGTDNLKDSTMERLADTGNGNYAYLDSLNEAYKVLVEQMGGTLVTVAKDVKLQVDFNPAKVEAYRLIGYENRLLANADFNNDRKDAGDMGAGHTVTALYEIIPRGGAVPGPDVDPLKYQPAATPAPVPQPRNISGETLTLKIRYKDPDGTESKLISLPLTDREGTFSKATADFRFAASVAEFGMILRNSPYRGKASVGEVIENAQASKGSDRNGYRQEFIQLVQRARSLRGLE
jgi:Ca-activated chloride channel family protein